MPCDAESGQMVCGSCRRLLSYPRGSKYVQCSGCETVNYVLEGLSFDLDPHDFFLLKKLKIKLK